MPKNNSIKISKTNNKKKNENKKKKKDPNAPKRALSAYIFFTKEFRPIIKRDNPTLKFGEIAKKLGETWREMDDEEKVPYNKLASEDKIRYIADKEEYDKKKNKENENSENDNSEYVISENNDNSENSNNSNEDEEQKDENISEKDEESEN